MKYRDQFLLSDSELADELLKITDHYVDELFEYPGQIVQYNPVSRLVMDPERFRDDDREEMSMKGMVVAYIKTSGRKELRKLTGPEREEIVRSLYDPYHEAFAGKVTNILGRHDKCLIIDAHSFPSKPLSYEDKGEIMIEINRSLYMNELTGQKLPAFNNVHEMIRGLFDQLK